MSDGLDGDAGEGVGIGNSKQGPWQPCSVAAHQFPASHKRGSLLAPTLA